MIELLQEWVTGITSASMLVAIAQTLLPEGQIKRIGRLTGGLILLLVVALPLLRMDTNDISDYLTEYQLQISQYSTEMEEEQEEMMKDIVAVESENYLKDQAKTLGVDSTFEVHCAMNPDGYPLPYVVHIRGEMTSEQEHEVSLMISEAFGIPADRQFFNEGEADETDEAD